MVVPCSGPLLDESRSDYLPSLQEPFFGEKFLARKKRQEQELRWSLNSNKSSVASPSEKC